MLVREIMTASVEPCSPDDNLATIAGILWRNDCGIVPVVGKDGTVLGVLTDRDVCMAVATKHRLASEIHAEEVFVTEPATCSPKDDVRTALASMERYRVRRLPVVDREGKLRGMLSLRDVIDHAVSSPGKDERAVTYEDVMRTLKSLCEHDRDAMKKTSEEVARS